MTSWPEETTHRDGPVTLRDGMVESLDFLLWLVTGHIRHYLAGSCDAQRRRLSVLGRPRVSLIDRRRA